MVSVNMDPTKGIIQRFAGTGEAGYTGDGGPACNARIDGPAGLAIDKNDNVYIVEIGNNMIRRVDARTGIIMTVAGCGRKGFSGDGGPATHAGLNGPEGVFVDSCGDIFIADTYNHRIRKVSALSGIISTIAGTGAAGYGGDGANACEAQLNCPAGVVADSKGNIYFNDYKNDRVRRIDPNGMISTHAGTGIHGYSGDGGPAYNAMINDVYGLGIDKDDNLYIMDSLNFAVRKVDAGSGLISTVVGKGMPGPVVEFENISGSFIGGKVHVKGSIGMEALHAVDVDREGNLFVGDTGCNRIRKVDFCNDSVYTVAGNGLKGCSGDGGPALDAHIGVHGLRLDSIGNLYFVDFHNHVVRVVRFA